MNIIARLRDLIRSRQQPALAPAPTDPYRAEDRDPHAALADLDAILAGQRARIRALERQIHARGEEPTPTPTGKLLLDVAEILDGLACREVRRDLAFWNTSEIGHLADLVRGLARFS